MIRVTNVSKRFGACQALNAVSLHLLSQRCYCFWGKNGAGKTTLLRLLSGLLVPDEGQIEVLGQNPVKDWVVRRNMGIVEDEDVFFPELTVNEFLWWVGRLRGMNKDAWQQQAKTLLDAFSLIPRAEDEIRCLSHGMRRKTLLASAFIGSPQIILLDEPTTGLDVDSLDALIALLKAHCTANRLAILACHDKAFVEKVCSDVFTIEHATIASHEVRSSSGTLQ